MRSYLVARPCLAPRYCYSLYKWPHTHTHISLYICLSAKTSVIFPSDANNSGLRQIRWSQWLSRYRLKFIHVPGSQNQSADALSQLFENPNNKAQLEDLSTVDLLLDLFENPNNKARLEDLSTVDLLLDKDGDDLMEERLTEREMFYLAAVTRAKNNPRGGRIAPPGSRKNGTSPTGGIQP